MHDRPHSFFDAVCCPRHVTRRIVAWIASTAGSQLKERNIDTVSDHRRLFFTQLKTECARSGD